MTEYRVRYEIGTALGNTVTHAYISRSLKRISEVKQAIKDAGYKYLGIDKREGGKVQGLTENWIEWRDLK